MKKTALILFSTMITSSLLANGGPVIYQGESYRDEIKIKKSAHQRSEKTREKMESNPRNKAMVESFEHVGDKDQKKTENDKEK